VVQGGRVTLSIVITNTATLPITNRWRRGGGFIATNILYSYVDFYTVTNAQPGSQNTNFVVVVQNEARPSPFLSSTASLNILTDSDGDGLPDVWESANGFATTNAADAAIDTDGDTLSNWEEYVAGTDPTNALSYLKIDVLQTAPNARRITFVALSNHTYQVLYKNGLQAVGWSELSSFAAHATNRIETAIDSSPPGLKRFYLLATPAQSH